MASTYSTSLRLELMATGDQSGTWGDTTNTNLGTLLEQAITGYVSVAQGDVANKTLTSLNGASDEARNMIVVMTGALTAARNVVVPTAEKLYLVSNFTTGGFSLTFKTSAGTGVSVQAGASTWVYCDGTNVINAATYMTSQFAGVSYVDAGATAGPVYELFRDSASPAVNDVLGKFNFSGRDSAANKQNYASIQVVISDPVSASEDAVIDFTVNVGGVDTRIASLGPNLDLPSGQIQFPAVQVPSSNANTLDDYEEGTWTPTFSATGATFSYSTQIGRYTKIGRFVQFTAQINLNTSGNTLTANALTMLGLPFSAESGVSFWLSTAWANSTSSYVNVVSRVFPGSAIIEIFGTTGADTTSLRSALSNAILSPTTGSSFAISGCFNV